MVPNNYIHGVENYYHSSGEKLGQEPGLELGPPDL